MKITSKPFGIPCERAEKFAGKMEHVIPDDVLKRFVGFAEFVERCPNSGTIWQGKAKGYFCRAQGSGQELCGKCSLTGSGDEPEKT